MIRYVEKNNNLEIILMEKAINVHNSPDIRNSILKLLEKNKVEDKNIYVNLISVENIDSCAVGLFLELRKLCLRAECNLILKNVSDRIEKILTILRVKSFFNIETPLI